MSNKSYDSFDAIVIGSGQGGTPLATTLAKAGWQVALIEREHVGGTCVNTGCTPTKTLIASAKVAQTIRSARHFGINASLESVDFLKVRKRKQDIVESFREGSRNQLLSTKGLSLIEGEARFVGKKKLEIAFPQKENIQLRADIIIINTGTRPSQPKIPGLEAIPYLNSTTAMALDQLPEHLLVIGGGYVGLEFGQMFRRFGSKISILQHHPQLLTREDHDIAEEIASIFKQEEINVLLDTQTLKVESPAQNKIILTIKKGSKKEILKGSHLLVATGRTPNTSALNLESTGITPNKRGFVPVNEYLETDVSGIFAIGDVKGGPQFTHISYDDYRILSQNILHKENASITGRPVPYVVYTDPQLGRIGLTEKDAKEQGYEFKVAKMPMSWVARAIETGETNGMMKVLMDAKTDQLLGAAILGTEGGEMMAILQVAMMGHLPYTALRDAIFSHPSLSEAFNSLFDMLSD